ncbi:hypothetical protein Q1695_014090 [Nippostrongylus brasiliensis]|nr:hypothetical protein Q1695_014090 [Nippostrongylus brasiliensis]
MPSHTNTTNPVLNEDVVASSGCPHWAAAVAVGGDRRRGWRRLDLRWPPPNTVASAAATTLRLTTPL